MVPPPFRDEVEMAARMLLRYRLLRGYHHEKQRPAHVQKEDHYLHIVQEKNYFNDTKETEKKLLCNYGWVMAGFVPMKLLYRTHIVRQSPRLSLVLFITSHIIFSNMELLESLLPHRWATTSNRNDEMKWPMLHFDDFSDLSLDMDSSWIGVLMGDSPQIISFPGSASSKKCWNTCLLPQIATTGLRQSAL